MMKIMKQFRQKLPRLSRLIRSTGACEMAQMRVILLYAGLLSLLPEVSLWYLYRCRILQALSSDDELPKLNSICHYFHGQPL